MSRRSPSFSSAFCGADFGGGVGGEIVSGDGMVQFCPPWHGSRPALNGMNSSARAYTLSDFDFHLPPELVAQHPTPERSGSRLLDGTGGTPADRRFRDLPQLLAPGD